MGLLGSLGLSFTGCVWCLSSLFNQAGLLGVIMIIRVIRVIRAIDRPLCFWLHVELSLTSVQIVLDAFVSWRQQLLIYLKFYILGLLGLIQYVFMSIHIYICIYR